jgi:hypothetical protein
VPHEPGLPATAEPPGFEGCEGPPEPDGPSERDELGAPDDDAGDAPVSEGVALDEHADTTIASRTAHSPDRVLTGRS